mmetsp:Transcript_9490/g.13452  ORF Transcript_9490/g.13452 Transcript_9490/m.13452 type:complete len:770 (+) Transcript_9490:54-2363(+)|eukprot:CAMPEP_0184865518 /NCGR_PEP_ID=MMETSP0580-20130426/18363_1 /TAXON_ID=1118495 /ORGANISM="Dactyliosolen fragilissimus" /LENGTH=769 /DNA_ID=CAMNT_0027364755 /DNA_START=30 /DNA_END=2339 /DNA_ORIENTATION=-
MCSSGAEINLGNEIEANGDSVRNGTILEAAFVDPAYSWPPAEGQGKNAIELQASTALLRNVDPTFEEEDLEDGIDPKDLKYPEPPKIKVKRKITTETETVTTYRGFFLRCCKSSEQVVNTHSERLPVDEEEINALKYQYSNEKARVARLRKEREKKLREKRKLKYEKEKYNRVPEGILIYRLDTQNRTLRLMSPPHSNTNMDTLVEFMVIEDAREGIDTSRRGIVLIDGNGQILELTACEQRTAIAWMEALDMMLGYNPKRRRIQMGRLRSAQLSDSWGGQHLNQSELNHIESQYLNLANYSNNLIRTGAIPGNAQKQPSSPGGIYYSIKQERDEGEDFDEETLESIAKRRAVIKDSWDFYRMICSLLRDRRKYDEVFRKMQLDPVYAYLNSMTGLNDPGDDGHDSADKIVLQNDLPEYSSMTRTQVCQDLIKKADDALPSLVEICKALAGSLGMEEVGVGPIKEVSSAVRKAEKKYEGDVLKITDYCRALLVVKDFPTLLALLELARDSFGPLIRRVKLSTLKAEHKALPGGYRDCKINLELKDHVCEIQVHIWPMWVVCGVDGFRHYRHCMEYSTDSFENPYDALVGLDKKTLAELIVMSEEAVADMPLDNLEWFHEKFILDYFAEIGLFLKHGLYVWAETTLRLLIKLRCESPDIGMDHSETIYLKKYLEEALRGQEKTQEADEVKNYLEEVEKSRLNEKNDFNSSVWNSFFALDNFMDPNKKEREEEELLKKEVRASKRAWRKIRKERFTFLDVSANESVATSIK